jgi:hypothetical protein
VKEDASSHTGQQPSHLPESAVGMVTSALATARIIEDINQVVYPLGIMSPKIELNFNAKQGKFW